jgi:hypothetical protein
MLEIHPGMRQYYEAIWQGAESGPTRNQSGGSFLKQLA